MTPAETAPTARPPVSAVPALLGAVHLVAHLLTNGRYGMFRDEFYYLACAERPAWGYVDHPPLSIAMLAGWVSLAGDSVHAIRVMPAVCGALLVTAAGFIARALGGGRSAQSLAALATAIMPSALLMTGFYSMNAWDLVIWSGLFLLLLRLCRTADQRLWIPLGLLAGLGLLNKHTVALFGIGLLAALPTTGLRASLRGRALWAGGALAILVTLPHLIWQVRHGWPTLEFMANARAFKVAHLHPLAFAAGQVVETHPFNAPIWIAGLAALLTSRRLAWAAPVGVLCAAVLVAVPASGGKSYYAAPVYLALLPAGAVWLDRAAPRFARRALPILLAGGGIVTAPMALPILPPERLGPYLEALHLQPPATERGEAGRIHPYFADRFGWEDMARAVSRTYRSLSNEDRERCLVLAGNYGEAAALEYFADAYPLPPVASGHNTYYLWGPPPHPIHNLLAIGFPREDLEPFFERVEQRGHVHSTWATPHENALPVYWCEGLRVPIDQAWPKVKRFI